jgi:hypothetical protein
MAVAYRIDLAAHRVIFLVTGTMDNDAVNASYAQLFSDKAFVPGLDLLVDLRSAEGHPTAIQQRERARRSGAMKHLMSGRVALLCATNDVHFGMARMYSVFAQEFGIIAEVFTSLEKAEQWLLAGRNRPPGPGRGPQP